MRVTGVLKDAGTGELVTGATVTAYHPGGAVYWQRAGTPDGKFSLSVPDMGYIEITHVGYLPITITAESFLNMQNFPVINLVNDVKGLPEVVVTAGKKMLPVVLFGFGFLLYLLTKRKR